MVVTVDIWNNKFMSEIADVLDSKFEVALELSWDKQGAVLTQDAFLYDLRYELIGLDCEQGGAFRYVVSRGSIDTQPVSLGAGVVGNPQDMDVTHQIIRIPRTQGDNRRLEDLSQDILTGTVLLIDGQANAGIELGLESASPRVLGALALNELALEIAGLRVAESLPIAS